MSDAGTLVLVVPCFNEARRLDPPAYVDGAAARPWLRLLFVDDGSTDETPRMLDDLARGHPETVSVLHLARNGGKAEAVRSGVLTAIEEGCDLTGYWDADLATPLCELDEMRRLAMGSGTFLVMGVRVPLRGRSVERRRARHYLGRVFANVASMALSARFYDTQCGAKVMRNNEMARFVFSRPFRARWVFDVEILARIHEHDLRRGTSVLTSGVIEHPLSLWRDVRGSRLKPRDFVRAAVDLAGVALSARRAVRGTRGRPCEGRPGRDR